MNDLSFEILNIIFDFCPDDSYKILDVNDIILALPEGIECDIDKLFQVVEDLTTEGSILLKYRDEEDICLAIAVKGRRIVKKERETRVKLEAQKKAREEEEARLRAIAEAVEAARLEQEEKYRLEKIEKEKKLEEAKLALEELKAQKKSKKDSEVIGLKQQVESLEKEMKPDVILPKAENTAEMVKADNISPVISNVQHMDFIPLVKRVGKVAFWGGLFGAIIGNALYYAVRVVLEFLG